MEEKELTYKDILKHYIFSLIIYGTIIAILILCPVYSETIQNPDFNYINLFLIYYIGYLIFAPIIYFIFKPKTLLESRSLTIVKYFERQFKKNNSTEEFLKNIAPNDTEKQAFTILFVKVFFGTYCLNLLCNKYLLSVGYNIDFLKEMFNQAYQYFQTGASLKEAIAQYIIDSGDMWLQMIMGLTTLVLAISYLTELDLFKNKIKSVDTTPLGILSCIACYYPITLLTDKFIQVTPQDLLPVNNIYLLETLNILAIIANIGILIAVLRLGTKSGNLTNRGIVTGFPYNIIRHPDYTMKIGYIIITTIPLLVAPNYFLFEKIIMGIATLAWIYLYYLRSITEERHLINDPEYKAYVEKVKYRFIPKLF